MKIHIIFRIDHIIQHFYRDAPHGIVQFRDRIHTDGRISVDRDPTKQTGYAFCLAFAAFHAAVTIAVLQRDLLRVHTGISSFRIPRIHFRHRITIDRNDTDRLVVRVDQQQEQCICLATLPCFGLRAPALSPYFHSVFFINPHHQDREQILVLYVFFSFI